MKDAQLNTLCQRHQAVLINSASNSITVAVVDAPSHALLDALHFATQKQIDIVCWTRQQMESHLHKPDQAPSANAAKGGETAAQLLNQTLRSAMTKRASDIHLEPGASRYRIRLRIDGVLHILQDIPKETGLALTARLKVLGNLDIAEHRLPQDGQFTVDLTGDSISFRIATLPCKEGEKVVLRLLHQVEQTLKLDTLGMYGAQLTAFRQALQQPQGLVLVTGPTGSGKTVTLYSALQTRNTPGINLCSVEDPIEIPLDGINQTQIHPRAGLTFQNVLRALLRQDPDIIMVGEIRDGGHRGNRH
ncbi:protein transport protein HofB [Salmonella enterica subsp. diarizonae]|uniref:Protein transport protein HofB n=1 Tax=Salmonella diarizonae TaxID=59204 RepID=A0A379U3G2_SALDZ|nr:protein transport protein HofB [Salmonella enterica subsp. diarizonae]